MKTPLTILFATFLVFTAVEAKHIHIVVPYVGSIHNQLLIQDMDQKLDDSSIMEGLYFQCINPQKYQWNLFLYHSKNLNKSTLLGNHFIFDAYFKNNDHGRFVAGIGLDYIRIDTDAESILSLTNFKMANNIYAPYIRIGRYLDFGSVHMKNSLLLWAGYERDILDGDIHFTLPPMPHNPQPTKIAQCLDKNYHCALAGMSLKVLFLHFCEVELKYHSKFDLDSDKTLHNASVMTNLYLNRKWGISYRYKYMEEVIGENQYHIGGVAFMF